jgi:sn-glycerol 3-phosphate transport system substrate-binding protein
MVLRGSFATAGALALASQPGLLTPARARQSDSATEVTFWHGFTGARGETLQALVDRYNALGTGVTVNALPFGSYEEVAENLVRALQDGSAPDLVAMSEALWFRFYLAGAIQPLDDLISQTGFDLDDLIPAFRVEGQRAGSTWWLPFSRSTPLVYYNQNMLADAGLDVFPGSWAEFAEIAPSLNDEDQQIVALAQSTIANLVAWAFQGVCWSFGGAYSDAQLNILIDEPGAIAAGNFYRRSIDEGWGYASPQGNQDLGNGFAAATIASTGVLNDTATLAKATGFTLGTAPLPAAEPGGPVACPTGGSGLFVVAGRPAEQQAAAFDFLAWCLEPDNTAAWAQDTGYMPVRTSAIEGEAMQAFFAENPNFRTVVDQLPVARPSDTARTWVPGGDAMIADAITRIIIESTDSESAFTTVAAELLEASQPVREQIIALEGDLGTPAATPVVGRVTR